MIEESLVSAFVIVLCCVFEQGTILCIRVVLVQIESIRMKRVYEGMRYVLAFVEYMGRCTCMPDELFDLETYCSFLL